VALRAALGVADDDLGMRQARSISHEFVDDPAGTYYRWHGEKVYVD